MYKIFKTLKNIAKHTSKKDFCMQTTKAVSTEINEIVKPPVFTPPPKALLTNNYIQEVIHGKTESLSSDEIPGPASLRALSKCWSLLPMMSTETVATLTRYFLERDRFKQPNKLLFKKVFEQYGPIVKLHGIFGSDIVLLCKPEHANVALNCDKHHFIRSYLDLIETYRKDWRRYIKTGTFLKLDENWDTVRNLAKDTNISINTDSDISEQFCDNFIQNLVSIRNVQGEVHDGLKLELYKWSLDCLSNVYLNTNFGFLKHKFVSTTSDSGRLLDSVMGASEIIKKLESGFHLWRFLETPTFHGFVKYCNNIDSVLSNYVRQGIKSLRKRKDGTSTSVGVSLLETLLLRDDLVEEDIMTILLDSYIVVTNAASHTVALLLYHLAKNPSSQVKLHKEIIRKGEIGSFQNLNRKSYLNACLKECLRLTPPLPIISRQLEEDIILNHYRISKGTYIFYSSQFHSSREEYFEDAVRYKPERWLSEDFDEHDYEYQIFATNTLGFGPEDKIVKRLMYVNVAKLVTKIVSKFKIEYNYGDVKNKIEFLSTNTKPINLRFVNRIK